MYPTQTSSRVLPRTAGGLSSLTARASSRRGSVMVIVISAVAVVGVMMLTLLSATVDSSKWTDTTVDSFQVEAAAETAVALAASQLWTGFERQTNGMGGLLAFQGYLGAQGVEHDPAGTTAKDFRENLAMPQDARGNYIIDGAVVTGLTVRREDAFGSTRLFIECATSNQAENGDNATSTFRVQHVYEIAAAEWEGTEFALLSNNVNCLLCHTTIDNAKRYYNSDPGLMGTFDRVRLGSIETFHVRNNPESMIAGSLYLGGDAVQADGSRLTDWHNLTLKSAEFDNQGILKEDAWGGLQLSALSPANGLTPAPMENLYLDYLAGGEESQVDGMLPSSFPSPFPDNGGLDPATGASTPEFAGNRKVDPNEFSTATAGTSGTVSGGSISVMPKTSAGRVRSSGALTSMLAGNSTNIHGKADANVYLNGTIDNPILLNGDVAIDGDLILSGYIKGTGSLRVSGNVYVPSDLQYLDAIDAMGNRSFGTAADGTNNTLAIASGGNVVIGDYYRPAWGTGTDTNGWSSGSFNFLMEEMSTFNRMEWIKTQATLPGQSVYTKTGENVWTENVPVKVKEYYWVDEPVYANVATGNQIKKTAYKYVTVNNGRPGEYYEEWQEKVVDYYYWVDEYVKVQTGTVSTKKSRWVATGAFTEKIHRDEIWEWVAPQYANPYYQGSNYIPRYYSFSKGSYVPIANKDGYFDPNSNLWMAEEMIGAWNSNKLNYARESTASDPYLYNADGSAKAAVFPVTPKDNWIDQSRMTKLIRDAADARDAEKDFHIDATLYSNNSIFGVVANDSDSGTNGRLLVNGLIVAADVGLLAPNGTQINYDPRGREMMSIESDSKLEIRRHLRTPLP